MTKLRLIRVNDAETKTRPEPGLLVAYLVRRY